jgi:hypothetical protein
LVIENVNYAQNVESVLVPNEEGVVTDIRNNISFSIIPLIHKEFGINSSFNINEIRLIRNQKGFYFITAHHFKNVYVFMPVENELKLKKIIAISDNEIQKPIFNWRNPFIEILSLENGNSLFLTEKGIITTIQEEDQL